MSPSKSNSVLIIGAYGLIGFGITNRLLQDGYTIIGLGRDAKTAERVLPNISWRYADIATLRTGDGWAPLLRDVSAVVNCSGALQDGPKDDLEGVHHHAVAALASACAVAKVRVIQISAVGASSKAKTDFLSSKARGDVAIKSSGAEFWIFRPGLVLAPNAYGGTAMLRILAAVPFVQPIAMPDAQIQTVAVDDVARAVSAALDGRIPSAFVGDLVEDTPHSLREVLAAKRRWLGFGDTQRTLTVPEFAANWVCKIADGLSYLGWRSPLRTTAFKVLTQGVTGDPIDMSAFGLKPLSRLTQTLEKTPANTQDRLFARMALITPLLIITMMVFWLLSGVIGLVRANEAAKTLEAVGWPHSLAVLSVVFWGVVDIGIAASFAVRKYAPLACWAAIGVSVFYLAASTIFVPALWIDPLGPLVKVLPAIVLALVCRIALETR